jgi:hypothetical protein
LLILPLAAAQENAKGLTMINETPMSAPEITIGHFLPILGTSIVADAARVAVTPGRSGKISSHPGPS